MALVVDKKRSIGLASKEIGVPEHVIRYWETQFPDYIKPTIGAGGRRYFFDNDIKVLYFIKDNLYSKGYTIKGLQSLLSNNSVEFGSEQVGIVKQNNDNNHSNSLINKDLVVADSICKNNQIDKKKLINFKEDLINFYNKLKNI